MAHIVVGLSGGVDSSVSAALLRDQGHSVCGLFMKNWAPEQADPYCSIQKDWQDAQDVCAQLQIPLEVVNFSGLYWEHVFQDFLEEHRAGRTPNPDVLCNQHIKFDAFLKKALALGADYIATGHYAQIQIQESAGCKSAQLYRALDRQKDQSYFLYRVSAQALAQTLFPLATYTKQQVRALAQRYGLQTADKKDSTGICFIGERPFRDFLHEYLPWQPGPISDPQGHVLGEHRGLAFYTLGQRQGLEIGGLKDYPPAPWYVLYKDRAHNRLIVSQDPAHPWAFAHRALLEKISWIDDNNPPPMGADHLYAVQCRYRQQAVPCTLHPVPASDQLRVEFVEAQAYVTPGQSLVIYDQDRCLGGGICAHTEPLINTGLEKK